MKTINDVWIDYNTRFPKVFIYLFGESCTNFRKDPYALRNSFGDMPTFFLKYFPKKDCDGKFNSSEICWILRLVDFNKTLASSMT